jgi:hypothetical protein
MLRTHDPREPHEARDPVAVTETGASPLDRESRSGGPVPAFPSQPDSPNRTPEPSRPTEPREVHAMRGRTFRLRDSEVMAMVELGKFRAIAQEHLIEFFYTGDKARFRADIENLVRQDLVEMKSVPHEESGSRTLLALTKLGHRFLGNVQAAPKDQVLYPGFAKPREAHHDADLYLLYQKAAEEIERNGGKSLRVVLDYEMKKRVYHDLAKLGKERTSSSRKREVAEQHSLQMVRGKIPVPDVRIEYETRDGEIARVDLELVTGHYRGRNLAEKVRAGFSIYARAEEASKLRRILDQRELTAEILSL